MEERLVELGLELELELKLIIGELEVEVVEETIGE